PLGHQPSLGLPVPHAVLEGGRRVRGVVPGRDGGLGRAPLALRPPTGRRRAGPRPGGHRGDGRLTARRTVRGPPARRPAATGTGAAGRGQRPCPAGSAVTVRRYAANFSRPSMLRGPLMPSL